MFQTKEGCEVYDACVDPDGLTVRVVEEAEVDNEDEQEEDLTDYYSQPEIFPDETVKTSNVSGMNGNITNLTDITEKGDGN